MAVRKVQILRTPGCSSCALALDLVKKIREEEKMDFEIEEIDITKNPELLIKYQIMASPGVVIDGKLEFTGAISKKALREKLIAKD